MTANHGLEAGPLVEPVSEADHPGNLPVLLV